MREILITILIIKRLNFAPLYILAIKRNTLNYHNCQIYIDLTIRTSIFLSNSKILKIQTGATACTR